MKKKKKYDNVSYINLLDNIKTYKDIIKIPLNNELNVKTEKFDIDNLVNITKTTPNNKIINTTNLDITFDKLYKNNKDKKDKLKKTIIYKLYPTPEQQNILLKWCDSYIDMYNTIIDYIKKERIKQGKSQNCSLKYNELDINLNLNYLKKQFYKEKEEINKKSNINMHILDYAMKDAVSSFKSVVSNLNNKHIKNSRLRYLKKNKPNKIIKIEKQICQSGSFCSSILGKDLKIKPDLKFNEIDEVMTIQYNNKQKIFYLFEKKSVKEDKSFMNKENKILAIDPGFRTFLTCISNDHILEIGKNPLEKINKLYKKIDMIKGKKVNNKKKSLLKYEKKISNVIKDIHNKIIDKLTKEYDEILIGNISTKSIVETKISSNIKRTANTLKIYQFREKLKNKCIKRNKKYKLIDEFRTSKCCSNCGNLKKEENKEKIYKCNSCNNTYDRDINASKNILLKGINTKPKETKTIKPKEVKTTKAKVKTTKPKEVKTTKPKEIKTTKAKEVKKNNKNT